MGIKASIILLLYSSIQCAIAIAEFFLLVGSYFFIFLFLGAIKKICLGGKFFFVKIVHKSLIYIRRRFEIDRIKIEAARKTFVNTLDEQKLNCGSFRSIFPLLKKKYCESFDYRFRLGGLEVGVPTCRGTWG